MSGVFTFMRILFLVVDFLAANVGTRSPVESGVNDRSLPQEQSIALLHTKAADIAPEKGVLEPVTGVRRTEAPIPNDWLRWRRGRWRSSTDSARGIT